MNRNEPECSNHHCYLFVLNQSYSCLLCNTGPGDFILFGNKITGKTPPDLGVKPGHCGPSLRRIPPDQQRMKITYI